MSSGSGELLFAALPERCVDLAGDVAFQAADDLALCSCPRWCAAEHREGGLGAEPVGVVAGRHQQRPGRVGADPERLAEVWGGCGGELGELGVEAADLGLE
jgi:hypothetical protein